MSVLRQHDLVAVVGLCCLQVVLVFLGIVGPVRAASGFLFVTLLPGYSLLAAVYGRHSPRFTLLEHVILAVPVSLALDIVLGLLLNNAGWSVQPGRLAMWLGAVTVFLVLAALCREARDGSVAYSVPPYMKVAARSRMGWGRRLLRRELADSRIVGVPAAPALAATEQGVERATKFPLSWSGPRGSTVDGHEIVLLVTILCLALALGFLTKISTPPAPPESVSLSLLDTKGQSAAYPLSVRRGQSVRIRVDIGFQGASQSAFKLASSTGTSTHIALLPGQTWTKTIEIRAHSIGIQRLSWTLWSTGPTKLRRSVHLWIRVR